MHFYRFTSAMKHIYLHLDRRSHLDVHPWSILLGEAQINEPVVFGTYSGTRVGDANSTTEAVLRIVSDRLVDMWRERGFTGWGTYPVEVYAKDGSKVEGLHGLKVLGRSGPIDESRSERISRCSLRGCYFDEETWDGSDMFVPSGIAFIFMTERMAVATLELKPKNVSIERIDTVVHPIIP